MDEWGTWYDQEPGSTPGFLYQQNSLRDALVAALNFHIFHKHADRVVMANIAQTVNVLQAMILTDKEKMLRTPTYWVFEMFKVHQGGTFLPVELQSPDYVFGPEKIPMVSASATRAADGSAVHLSLANTSPTQGVALTVRLSGLTASGAVNVLCACISGAVSTRPVADVGAIPVSAIASVTACDGLVLASERCTAEPSAARVAEALTIGILSWPKA